MAELLQNNQQIRSFLGAAYSASDDVERIMPYFNMAETTYIEKAISTELLAYLKTIANNENSASDKDKSLLMLVRRALAFYGYWMYLPYSTGIEGDNGLQETKTERTQPIRQSMLEKRIATTGDYAASALESVLLMLFSKPSDWESWNNSDTYKAACKLFIRNGSELKKGCPLTRGHHRVYLSMREYLEERQRKSIIPILGSEFADELLNRFRNEDLSPSEKDLIPYIQRALGYSAYDDALLQLTVVQLPSGGLRVLSEFDGINNQRALSDQDKIFCEFRSKIGEESEAYQRELRKYLDAHADDFPEYISTPESSKPKTWPIDNTQYKTVIRMR